MTGKVVLLCFFISIIKLLAYKLRHNKNIGPLSKNIRVITIYYFNVPVGSTVRYVSAHVCFV